MKKYVATLGCLALLIFVGASAGWAQGGSPTVYVSASGGQILSVNTATGAVTVLVSTAGADYEGLVVGPDNADNNTPGYLLYACDPTNNTIIRFDPNNSQAGVETVYSGGTLQQPQCGRFTNKGDLIVTSEVPGSGIWKIANVANTKFTAGGSPAGFAPPTQASGAVSGSQVSQGIAQKNDGDLLVVDTAGDQIIRTQYATQFSNPTVFIPNSSLLPGPFGIARASNGDIYVSNQAKNANNIIHFNAQGTGGTTCVKFKNTVTPWFMQMTPDDTLYVATSTNTSGTIYSVNAATCSASAISASLPPVTGIAVPLPLTNATQQATFNGTHLFQFNYTAYQFTSGGPCTLNVQAIPTNLAVINSQIATAVADDPTDLSFGAAPAVNLGWDGFEIAFNVSIPPNSSCTPQYSDGTFSQLLGADLDNFLVSNPRIIRCATATDPNPPGCAVVESFGSYPLGGLLPQDGTYSGKGTQCQEFLVNGNQSTSEPGLFCGFQSPLANVQPPQIAAVFSSGQNLTVKFKLAQASGNCQNGPYITDAVALLSIAQIADANGNTVFNPVAIGSSGSSTPAPPTFKVDNNQQYQFSLSLKGYAKGIYSLTVTFLTSNTFQQTVLFQVI